MDSNHDHLILDVLESLNGYSETYKLSLQPQFASFCDWGFWRRKALRELRVPDWYFDLPFSQGRELSGSKRFLEVASKFSILLESVVETEGKNVKGIYSRDLALHLTEERGEFEMMKSLSGGGFGVIRSMINFQRRKIGKLPQIPYRQSFGENLSKDNSEVYHQISAVSLLNDRNFLLLEEKFMRELYAVELGILASTGNEEVFPLIERLFDKFDLEGKMTILSFSLGSRKPNQFLSLLQKRQLPHENLVSLLQRAYFTAEMKCISHLEELGCIITIEEKIKQLSVGYQFDPRPVEVYQILSNLSGLDQQEYLAFTSLSVDHDIDLALLFIGKDVEMMKAYLNKQVYYSANLLRYCVSQLKKQGQEAYLKEIFTEEKCPIRKKIFKECDIHQYTENKRLIPEPQFDFGNLYPSY